jgi:hypothetical protein
MREELRKQLRFLDRSAKAYDEGDEEEAVRMATVMRVLFHDTFNLKTGKPISISLLTLLGMRNGSMLASPPGHGNWKDFLAVRLDVTSPTPSSLTPRLDLQLVEVPFSTWWESASVKSDGAVSRRRLITSATNKDGGAHVDPKLDRFYQGLMKGTWSIGLTGNLTYNGPPPFEQGVTQYPPNGHLALLRQFSYEVLTTAQTFGWTTDAPSSVGDSTGAGV